MSEAADGSPDGPRASADRTLPSGQAATWNLVRETTVAAQAASIARKEQTITLVRVTAKPLELPDKPWLAVTTARAPVGGWSGCDFFVIDADTKDARQPIRHRAELKYKPTATRFVLEITPAMRRALGTATHVHVAHADDRDLDMMRSLHAQLSTNASRGPCVEELWTGGPPVALPSVQDGLNPEQSQALTAMTTSGGWLVWGPPGTGKTKVIVHAVRHALTSGRSVLIASHTHVGVDNVVKDLAVIVTGPGQVVRVGSDQKVDDEVLAHNWLLHHKAAAAVTRREERLAALMSRQQANRDHLDRSRLETVLHALDEGNIGLVEQAVDAIEARGGLSEKATQLAAAEDHRVALDTAHRDVQTRAEEQRRIAAQLPLLERRAWAAHQSEVESTSLLARTHAQLHEIRLAHAGAVADRHRAEAAAQSWSAKLPWRSAKLADAIARGATHATELDTAAGQLERALPSLTRSAQRAHDAAEDARHAVDTARAAANAGSELSAQQQELLVAIRATDARVQRLRSEIDSIKVSVERVSDPDAVVAEAEATGVLALRDDRDQLIESVAELDDQHNQLDQERAKLDDEYKDTLRSLLEDSPVIACTLSALTTKTELANRRFDVVIVDEAASASIPHLIYAGSKADYGLAFVGDFLQNEPITDPGDAVTEEQRAVLPWQQSNIFGLLGIDDRASAQAHPRCIALRTQYRYPSTIADIVNDFCYDGLLESVRHARPEDGTTVTVIDTSSHPRRGLRREGRSWVHDLGLEILDPVVHDQDDGVTIGLVCPYKAHADQAGRIAQARRLPVECGTSHKFQGRQFDTVIVDLMQDEQTPRWIAAADIHGDQRAASAARLLNVAITRAQQRLYLIGDWHFITRTDTPGMRALAALATNPHFEVVAAVSYTDVGGRRNPNSRV